MKLVKAYINAFGNLEKKEIDFKGGLNSFYEKNGAGKTTLALFIKAMFYGLEKNTKKNQERERVLPYSNELCSGYLIFEFDGKEYKIERSFDKKPSNDTCRVTINGRETTELGEIPGERVFGYNAESFTRTLFIDSNDLNIESTDDLNGKLGRFVEGDDEKVNYQKVIDGLESLRKKYSPDRKTQTLGLIDEKKKEINDLYDEKNSLEITKNSLDEKYKVRKTIQDEADILSKEAKEASKINQIGEQWKHYDSLKGIIDVKENKINEIKARYINGLPSLEEEKILKQLNDKRDELLISKKQFTLSDDEIISLKNYKEKYSNVQPSNDDMSSLKDKIKSFVNLSAVKDENLSNEEKATISKFAGKKDEIVELKDIFEKYEAKEREYNAISATVIVPGQATNKHLPQKIALYIASGIFFLLGVILGILVSFWCFFITLAIVPCIVFIARFIKNDKKAAMPIEKDNPDKERAKEDLKLLQNMLVSSFKGFSINISDAQNLAKNYYSLLSSYENYEKYKEKEETFKKNNEARHALLSSLENEIKEAFKKYNIKFTVDYYSSVSSYENELSKYTLLKERNAKFNTETQKIDKEISLVSSQMDSLKIKFFIGDVPSYLDQLSNDRQSINYYEKDLMSTRNELSKYVAEKTLDIATRPSSFEEIDIEEKQNELENKQKQLITINREIDALEDDEMKLAEDVSQLSDKEGELKELKAKLSIIKSTIDSIKLAEENLKNRYIKPIKDTFTKYSSYLEENGLDVTIDGSFSLKIIEKGLEKDYIHLSNGELTLCSLCYRLAIIDNIFGKENEPFLVLDDLFADLDEEHLSKAKLLLKDLSKDRQIIYFTCHESRNVNS